MPPTGDSHPGREELITASGIRIVGAARALFSEAATAGLTPPSLPHELLFAATFRLAPRLGSSATSQFLDVLNQAGARANPGYRLLTRDHESTEDFGRFHGRHWQVATGPDRWIGELVWRHPHPVQLGLALTSHLVLNELPGITQLTVRVGIPGGLPPELGPVLAGQAHPQFLRDLQQVARLTFGGVNGEPHLLHDADIDDFVGRTLLGEARTLPVVVLAPTETGAYLIPPGEAAEELLGLAHLYVVDRHPTTFRLTDALGDKRLSCYWGAMRAYLTDFSCADAPHRHPLLIGERVSDPVVRAQFRGSLALALRSLTRDPDGVATLREPPAVTAPAPEPSRPPAPVPATAPEAATTTPPARRAEDAPTPIPANARATRAIAALEHRLGDVLNAVEKLTVVTTRLLDEVAGIRTTDTVRGATAGGLERRIGDLERWLRSRLAPQEPPDEADANAEPPEEGTGFAGEETVALSEVVRQVAVTHSDVLLILDKAIASAEASPYQDVDRVAAVLDAMALVARRRQAGTLGTALREAFRELGVDYRRGVSDSTSARMMQQYVVTLPDGGTVDATEHIVLGTSYDPRHCLRIYFTSRAPAESRFVVAHVGRHMEVKSTT